MECFLIPGAVEKVKTWQPPRNRTELASFFGFANYYREFVKDFATKVLEMSSLIPEVSSFSVDPRKLKNLLITSNKP